MSFILDKSEVLAFVVAVFASATAGKYLVPTYCACWSMGTPLNNTPRELEEFVMSLKAFALAWSREDRVVAS